MFLTEEENRTLTQLLREQACAGVELRIMLGDPSSPEVERRGIEDGICEAMTNKIRIIKAGLRPRRAGRRER